MVEKPTPPKVAALLRNLRLPGAADYDPVWANRAGDCLAIVTRDSRLSQAEKCDIAQWVLLDQYHPKIKVPGLAFHRLATSPKTHPDLVSWAVNFTIRHAREQVNVAQGYTPLSPLNNVLIRDIIRYPRRLAEQDFLALYSFLTPTIAGTEKEAMLALLAYRVDCPLSLMPRLCFSPSYKTREAVSRNPSCPPEWKVAAALKNAM